MFKNGTETQFETDTDVREVTPVPVNDFQYVVTENEHAINMSKSKKRMWFKLGKISKEFLLGSFY